ncbi:MAG TPA: Rho termination factor N-terminal domain-containing protein, partial [Actinomycetes bacterium]|nr:Rho termination factor N-terminal domain-containing protein [Actinomycetes bacterium]
MSDTTETLQPASDTATSGSRRRSGGLNGMVLAELQTMASGLGITGTARLRKSQLIEAIQAAQGSSAASKQDSAAASRGSAATTATTTAPTTTAPTTTASTTTVVKESASDKSETTRPERTADRTDRGGRSNNRQSNAAG